MIHQGERLREIIRDSGITDSVLAEKLNMSRGGIQNIYLKQKIKTKQLEEVASVLGMTLANIEEKINNIVNCKESVNENSDPFISIKNLYERLIVEKDSRIALLEARIKELEKK
jgi:transcriptional regulator with XRE-family HTH domain